MAKDPKDYPFIVWMRRAETGLRWLPSQPTAGLEPTLLTAYQRGGIIGQFQTLGNAAGTIRHSFIPWHEIGEIETKKSYEDRTRVAEK